MGCVCSETIAIVLNCGIELLKLVSSKFRHILGLKFVSVTTTRVERYRKICVFSVAAENSRN
jgi:hypothetical protein